MKVDSKVTKTYNKEIRVINDCKDEFPPPSSSNDSGMVMGLDEWKRMMGHHLGMIRKGNSNCSKEKERYMSGAYSYLSISLPRGEF